MPSFLTNQFCKKQKPYRHSLAIFYMALTIIYLVWRVTIINPHYLIFSWVFFISSLSNGLLNCLSLITTWAYGYNPSLPAPENASVDVFITTYQEDIALITETVKAALQIDYPHRTIVLDDGNRVDIKQLAERLGALYFARGSRTQAKAGNINFGLTKSTAEFFATFDADHIPQKEALSKLLGYFKDPAVALVQTPQTCYNVDAFPFINARKNHLLWHDQSVFYRMIQPNNDKLDAGFCVGTGGIYRREAIDSIGGLPGTTATEDVHTSLKLTKQGWKIRYIDEAVSYGVAATDLSEYYRTRYRWGDGNISVLREENVLFCRGLSLYQRLSYLNLGLIYMVGWQQLVLFALPIITLFFASQPFVVTGFNVLIVLLFPLISWMIFQETGYGFARFWTGELLAVMRLPLDIMVSKALLTSKFNWLPSTKQLKSRFTLTLMLPQLILGVSSVAAIIYGIWHLYPDFKTGAVFNAFLEAEHGHMQALFEKELTPTYVVDLLFLAGFWALFNATKVAIFVRKVYRQASFSIKTHLFSIRLPILLHTPDGSSITLACTKVSLTEVHFFLPNKQLSDLVQHKSIPISLFLPSGMITGNATLLPVKKTKLKRPAVAQIPCRALLTFPEKDKEAEERLKQTIFSFGWHRLLAHPIGYFLIPSRFFKALVKGKLLLKMQLPEISPVLIESVNEEETSLRFATVMKDPNPPPFVSHWQLVGFCELNENDVLRVKAFVNNTIEHWTIKIKREFPDVYQLFMRKNLDGTTTVQYDISVVESSSE